MEGAVQSVIKVMEKFRDKRGEGILPMDMGAIGHRESSTILGSLMRANFRFGWWARSNPRMMHGSPVDVLAERALLLNGRGDFLAAAGGLAIC